MAHASPDLVCVGRIVREMIYFPNEVKGPVLGSPPAYCAVAAARQGTSTGIVSKIGVDISEDLLAPIIRAGVNMAGLLIGERSTQSELIYDAQGNKEIRYPSMSKPIQAQDIPVAFHGCDLIYICPMDEDVQLGDLSSVIAKGHASAIDLGGYGGVHMSKARRQTFSSLAKLALDAASLFDIVKASDEDATSIFGWNNPEEAGKRLLECGPKIVLITLGKNGALVCTRERNYRVPAFPGNVIDTTGGGDTFMAGFLSEYLRTQDPLQSTLWGCATATYVIEQSGGVRFERMPTRQQVSTVLTRANPDLKMERS
jgi:2-dehydro-3-deoxygluconokinase